MKLAVMSLIIGILITIIGAMLISPGVGLFVVGLMFIGAGLIGA